MSFFKTVTLICDVDECVRTFSGPRFHYLSDARTAAARIGWIYLPAVITENGYLSSQDFCERHNPNAS